MIQEEVLFQGTWAEALEHPDKIPSDCHVRIIGTPSSTRTPEENRALIDDIIARAKAIPPDADAPARQNDPYYQALVEKYRKQGFELK